MCLRIRRPAKDSLNWHLFYGEVGKERRAERIRLCSLLSVWLISFAIHFSTRFHALLAHSRRVMDKCRVVILDSLIWASATTQVRNA